MATAVDINSNARDEEKLVSRLIGGKVVLVELTIDQIVDFSNSSPNI